MGLPFGFGFESTIRRLFKFYFFDFELSDKVLIGRHAVAIDDERKSFHPLVWDEKRKAENGGSANSEGECIKSEAEKLEVKGQPRIKQV